MQSAMYRSQGHSEEGFTLMELLIVMSLIVIIMAIAIPSYQGFIRRGNELSAVQSIRAINEAQLEYQRDYPQQGYACNIGYLGGDKASGAPTATAAQFLPQDLAAGVKSGYTFTISNCSKTTVNNQDHADDYVVTAVPLSKGKSGNRGYCSDSDGAIKFDLQGGTNCTTPVQ